MSKLHLINKDYLTKQFTPQPHNIKNDQNTNFQQLFIKLRSSQDKWAKRMDAVKRATFSKYQSTRLKTVKTKNYYSQQFPPRSADEPRIADCLQTQSFVQMNPAARNALFLKEKKKKILNLLQQSNIKKISNNLQIAISQKDIRNIKVKQEKRINIIRTRTSIQNLNRNNNKFNRSNKEKETLTLKTNTLPQKTELQPVPQDRIVFFQKNNQDIFRNRNMEPICQSLDNILAQAYGVFICNGHKFQIIHQKKSKKCSQVASLTKIMTSVLILSIIKKFNLDIKVQKMRVGHKAAGLQGTTANLQYGDHLTIQDALYGLMLPSGNDAAQALAQWGGKKIRQQCNKFFKKSFEQIGKRKSSPLKLINMMANNDNISYSSLFIYHMNQLARALKMSNSKFNNPHGLMDKNNFSCAFDTALLSHYAIENFPQFRKIVQTSYYKTKIFNKTFATQRQVQWRNTHKLLKIPAFKGIKTGITPTAGPCLSSYFSLGQKQYLLIVVLKAKNQQHRFIQTKRLISHTLNLIGRQDLLHYVENPKIQSIQQPIKETNQNIRQFSNIQNQFKVNLLNQPSTYAVQQLQEQENNIQLSQSFMNQSQSQSERDD